MWVKRCCQKNVDNADVVAFFDALKRNRFFTKKIKNELVILRHVSFANHTRENGLEAFYGRGLEVPRYVLRQNITHYLPMHIRQSKSSALIFISQLLVIDAE